MSSHNRCDSGSVAPPCFIVGCALSEESKWLCLATYRLWQLGVVGAVDNRHEFSTLTQ
jgi:hypothetical protein